MIPANSNLFNIQKSAYLIETLEKCKSKLGSTDHYWPRWLNLFRRDFPKLPCPEPKVPADKTSASDINLFKADYYENMYREAEIEQYVEKINILYWLVDLVVEKLSNGELLRVNLLSIEDSDQLFDLVQNYEDDEEEKEPITPTVMAKIRKVFEAAATKMAESTHSHLILSAAIDGDSLMAVDILIEANIDVTIPDQSGRLPISHALKAEKYNIDIICVLLEQMFKKQAIQKKYANGTVLDMLVQHGDVELIENITKRFPTIQLKAYENMLWAAVKENNRDMVSYFLDKHQFDPNMHVANTSPILLQHLYLRTKHAKTGGYIGRANYNPNDTKVLTALIDGGAHINIIIQSHKMSPLMYAASQNMVSVVQLLLEKGADPRMTNPDGKTASDFTNHAAIKTMLEQHLEQPQHKKYKSDSKI